MKIILLQDVANLGRKYDVKEVSNGYASNFLFPKKLATPATKEAEASVKLKKAQTEQEKKIKNDLLLKNIESLADTKVVIKAKANEEGHLYAKIHQREISKAIKEQLSLDIPEEALSLPEPIKAVGESEVDVLFGDKKSKISIFVEVL